MRVRPVRVLLALLLTMVAASLAAAWYYSVGGAYTLGERVRDRSLYQFFVINRTRQRSIVQDLSSLIHSKADHMRNINLLNNRRYNREFGGVKDKANEELFLSQVDSDSYAKRFPFRSDFTLPQPEAVRSTDDINRSLWVHDLRVFLASFSNSTQLSLVTSNSKYTDVLLNWLISYSVRCQLPLANVLVLSIDSSLHYMLVRRGINSVYLPLPALLNPRGNFSTAFDQVMMTRLVVMRIINHFGFDVVNYDTDAVLLKDPQPLYDELRNDDIIGSVGKIPDDLVADWGITICIGVVLVRSNVRTEDYWNSMPGVCQGSFDDQQKLNCGLKALDIRWQNNDSDYQNTTVFGVTKSSGVRVSILPYKHICRQLTCEAELRSTFYIWHKGGSRKRRDKIVGAREGQTWFLRYKWDAIRNNFTGRQWLDSVAYYNVTRS